MAQYSSMSIAKRKKCMSKKVHGPWYQRYISTVPSSQQLFLQPLKELKAEEEMMKAMASPSKQVDRTEELIKALTHEKMMKIDMVLALALGDSKKMRERVTQIKPATSPLKYVTEKEKEKAKTEALRYTDHKGNAISLIRYLMLGGSRKLKDGSKWALLAKNRVVRQKIRTLIKEKYHSEIAHKWRKAIRRVRAVLRFFQIIAHIARTTGEVFKKFRNEETAKLSTDETGLFFDKTYFKAIKKGRELSKETLFTLSKPEHYRTWEEAHKVAEDLRFVRSFSILPKSYQDRLAMIAWYMEIPGDKVIIREGHVADSFYFLITGRAVAVKLNGSPLFDHHARYSVLKIFEKDDMFGEEGICDRINRNYSVTSMEKCTILSVNIDDYYRIFNFTNSEDENPDHIRLLSQMDFMKYFPMEQLIENSEGNVIVFYYRRGTLITKHSSASEFIYVVKSGICRVLASIKKAPPKNKSHKCLKVLLPPVKEKKKRQRDSPKRDSSRSRIRLPKASIVGINNYTPIISISASPNEDEPIVIYSPEDIYVNPRDDLGDSPGSDLSTTNITPSYSPFTHSQSPGFTLNHSPGSTNLSPAISAVSQVNQSDAPEENENANQSEKFLSTNDGKLPRRKSSRVQGLKLPEIKRMSVTQKAGILKIPGQNIRRVSKAGSEGRGEGQRGSARKTSDVKKVNIVMHPSSRKSNQIPRASDASDAYTVIKTMENFVSSMKSKTIAQSLKTLESESAASTPSPLLKAASIEKVLVNPNLKQTQKKTWVCVKMLRESDVFGLDDLDFGDAKEPSDCAMALVSEGAEMILISKKFFMENATPVMLSYLRSCSYIPTDEMTLIKDLQKREYWAKFQEKTVEAFYKEMQITRTSNKPADN
ncbi:uncharacterized protein LOC131936590 [Physella acuta]|uniref:uncharacterized protein LOC131936590 n=1 Tax=Physella acuta TaxID=109671 RepID=UPI0027DC2F1D|nr:uncharacterized protein LOC131936590 [Physella acuta]